MKSIFIINTLAGHYKKKAIDKKIEELSKGFEPSLVYLYDNTPFPDIKTYNRVVAFGGDGTLNSLLNAEKNKEQEIIYIPIGTLNEAAKTDGETLSEILSANERNVAYVFACGIFTPLGYNTNIKSKKRLKVFAYIFNVLREYKVIRIKASINISKESIDENKEISANPHKDNYNEYSLIMCLKSKYCFGFPFNKVRNNSNEFEFLSIKSPKHSGLLGKIELFFPLFRCFFIGFKKEYYSKYVTFEKVKKVSIQLEEKTSFCIDGEKAAFSDNIALTAKEIQSIKILKK